MVSYNKYLKEQETRRKIVTYLRSKGELTKQEISFNVPHRLFRYSGVNQYLLENLEKSTLTLSHPMLFNDYYDAALHCNSFQSRYADELERIELLQMMGETDIEPISIEKLKKEVEHDDRFLSQYMKGSLKVGCLSEDNQSILMWSHYANKNQGICIEYDFVDSDIQPFMYPVIYLPNPVDCTDLCDTHVATFDIDLATLLSTVSKCDIWGYEKEWRTICYYPPESIERVYAKVPKPKAIYLGRTFLQYWINNKRSKEFKLFTRLCEYIKKNDIELYVMVNKLMSFELYPKSIDIDRVIRLSEDDLYDDFLV